MRFEDWVPATKAQAAFAESDADTAVFFGSCGGGKTSSLVHEAVQHPHALIVTPGSLFALREDVHSIHEPGDPILSRLQLSRVRHDEDAHRHAGLDLAFLGIERIEEFSERSIWYLASRLRRGPARMRATMRAQQGYAGELLQWWFHAGKAIDSRNGVVRWLLRTDDKHYWFDAEADARASGRGDVWSVAVIAAEWTAIAGATYRDHPAYRDLAEDA